MFKFKGLLLTLDLKSHGHEHWHECFFFKSFLLEIKWQYNGQQGDKSLQTLMAVSIVDWKRAEGSRVSGRVLSEDSWTFDLPLSRLIIGESSSN